MVRRKLAKESLASDDWSPIVEFMKVCVQRDILCQGKTLVGMYEITGNLGPVSI